MPGSNSRPNVSEGYEVPLSYRGDRVGEAIYKYSGCYKQYCIADHVPDWQPRVLLGMVEARSVNVKKTTTTNNSIEFSNTTPTALRQTATGTRTATNFSGVSRRSWPAKPKKSKNQYIYPGYLILTKTTTFVHRQKLCGTSRPIWLFKEKSEHT